MNKEPCLAVKGLEIRYGKVCVVSGVDFTVNRGIVTTLIGSNGAGKTTIMKGITGMQPVTAGRIHYCGEDITGMKPDQVTRRGIVLVPEGRRLFSSMTVLENLKIGAWLRSDGTAVKRSLDQVLSYFPDLASRLQSKATMLSGGQQQMVAFGRALMAAPRLLMMDEPSVGLAPVIVQRILEIIKSVSEQGIDVLLVEQNASLALKHSDEAYVVENGCINLHGLSKELANDENVRRAYLGL
jgi:branched-chain amino acid transport system ATP-binding protein